MAKMTTLHIIPLQLDLHSDLTLALLCDDPRAKYDASSGILTINLATDRRTPYPNQQSVQFVVRDPSPTDTKYYATLYSGYNSDALVQWPKDGDVSRSPYIAIDSTAEIWTTILAIPQDPRASRIYKGRNKVKIIGVGAGDDITLET